MLVINDRLTIPDRWLEIRTSRSGGPGGQHVNKTETQVELRLDVAGCDVLALRTKSRLRELAGSRMTAGGILRVVCGQSRSQGANQATCEERMRGLVLEALRPPPPPRRPTKVTRGANEKRLKLKKARGKRKSGRNASYDD